MILAFIGFVGLCLLVAAANGAITQTSLRTWYLALTEPPGTPPVWAFGPVWAALYVLMGIAAWMVWRQVGAGPSLRLWGWQLLCNALWTPAFFGARSALLGLLVIPVVVATVVATTHAFYRINRPASLLMLPYVAGTLYVAYLNIGFWWLNAAHPG